MGLKVFPAFASGSQLGGISYVMSTVSAKEQTRDSSETSFMKQALGLPNYNAYVLAQAKQITFSANQMATGVWVETQGLRYYLAASKEIIVSAGTFASPQLLMVSGVGPADAVKKLNVPVVADRPGLGKDMQDHLYFGQSYRVKGQTTSSILNVENMAAATEDYHDNSAGILTNPSNDIITWEKFPQKLRKNFSNHTQQALASYPRGWTEIELLAINACLGFQNTSGSDPNNGQQYATMGAAQCMPPARGSFTLAPRDNAVQPIINPTSSRTGPTWRSP